MSKKLEGKPNVKPEEKKTEERDLRFPKHLEEFKKMKEKIEKVEGTDFKTFLKLLKSR